MTDGNQTVDGGVNLKNNFAAFKKDSKFASKERKTSKVNSMCIVPVKIKHWDDKSMIRTYAMLDVYSQGSFVHNNFVKIILKLTTLHDKYVRSIIVEKGKRMTVTSGDDSLLIPPNLYARTKKTL